MFFAVRAHDAARQSGLSKPKASNRIVGMVLAVVAGMLFGNTFSPVTYVEKGKDGPYGVGHGPTQDLDYVFSHFTGARRFTWRGACMHARA